MDAKGEVTHRLARRTPGGAVVAVCGATAPTPDHYRIGLLDLLDLSRVTCPGCKAS